MSWDDGQPRDAPLAVPCTLAADVTESARLLLPGALPWQVAGPGCALASGAADADGFYYACLEKRA